ncbi:EF-hand domain [Macleaya cordata]|uniref:EF-hand domain n=1 Tax=Macleaya cordata TaxID=56857 RepID=A0A200PY84_MACCD|nr:EF-hand domain [Macleaya cordata]
MGIKSFLGRKKKRNSLVIPSHESPRRSPALFTDYSTRPVQELEQVFKKLDTDGDGQISWIELGSMMSSSGCTSNEDELRKIIKSVDSNGDGFIDLSEFIELNAVDNEKHFEDVKLAFSLMDANGDGSISPQELQNVLRNLGDDASIQDCTNMISAVDSDGDGYVSLEAFMKMMIHGSASEFSQR